MRDLPLIISKRRDLHQSRAYSQVMQKIHWRVHNSGPTLLYSRTLGPLTVAKVQRYSVLDPEYLNYFRKKNHTLATFLEPGLGAAAPSGLSVEPYAHSKSALIDLAPSPDTIINSFTQKTRYNITHNQKNNLLKLTTTPLSRLTQSQKADFFGLHQQWSKRKNVIGYSQELLTAILASFGSDGKLHLAYSPDKNPVASLLILTHDSIATYYAAFSSLEGYHLYAPTLLTYHAMLTAKDDNCDIFDFGGIYDPRYPKMYKKWQGFTQFKRGFNPTTIQYPPTKLRLFW